MPNEMHEQATLGFTLQQSSCEGIMHLVSHRLAHSYKFLKNNRNKITGKGKELNGSGYFVIIMFIILPFQDFLLILVTRGP